MAFVVLQPSSKSAIRHQHEKDVFEKELKAFAKPRLPGFARPEWVQVLEELPVSNTESKSGIIWSDVSSVYCRKAQLARS